MPRVLTAGLLFFAAILGAFLHAEDGPAKDSPAKATPIGRKIDAFSLGDFRGKVHSLDDLRDKKAVVVVFLGTECPLAKQYAPRLQALSKEYTDKGVGFLAINANSQDSITEIAAYARIHELTVPVLKDAGNHVADAFGAERTPEAFVLDADHVVRYRGRIDDQFAIGSVRKAPARRDVAAALDELLAGKPVSQPETPVTGCHIGRVRQPDEASSVTYSNQIARILQNRCVECHRPGEIGPFALTEYSEVAGWAEMIDEVVREERMPPWHADPKHGQFADDRRMSDDEKRQIHEWVTKGAPQGNAADLPKPREYVTGWLLPRPPDQVVAMGDKPFDVPAEGTVRYQYFQADPKFTEDKWIQGVEVIPGNRAVVHHVLVFARRPGEGLGAGEGAGGFLASYVPGLRPKPYGEGLAKHVPAGSQIVFQVHYTPIGTATQDLSKVGFLFADPKTVTHEVRTVSSAGRGIRIPPNAPNHEELSQPRQIPAEATLLALAPHMHVRGKSFQYEATFPDGRKEILLDVPHYDFNWQTTYRLAKPRTLPAGTKIACTAHYDNSAANLNNPDPNKLVRWGDQTWDEMLLGYFDISTPVKPEEKAGQAKSRARQILQQFDKDGDDVIRRDEVPERLRGVFDRLDTKKDGELTLEDLNQSLDKLPEN